ncbi:MAG TPA: MarR family winged helix-turn-helix transcriptional regulator [Candidatus Sulfotelmatobacter sp.]|nr:MarR family winged helix-turn-helix transcriptional regulator [Candidatus Sulfotelmatobacter sp.]
MTRQNVALKSTSTLTLNARSMTLKLSESPAKRANSGDRAPHRPYVRAKEKTSRAYEAYLDILETAAWLEERFTSQLKNWEMTTMQFRLMDTIYREGPQYLLELTQVLRTSKQNVGYVVERLVGCGCLEKAIVALPSITPVRSKRPKADGKAEASAEGRRVTLVRLSVEGKRFIAYVSPRHRKVVKAQMRVIEGREQQTLSRILRKLREGDVIKFLREMRMTDEDQKPWGG